MKTLIRRTRYFSLLGFLLLLTLPLAGCGSSSSNTVVEPDDSMMDAQEMADYEKQMQDQNKNYEDNYR